MPTFGTVCDGIGCGHLAFNQVGFECAWSFEIEPFPSAVLAERFPEVTNHGDMLKCAEMILSGKIDAPDVFIGGTPCQSWSVAGKRKGLEDARGNLSLTFCGIADAVDDVRRRDGKPPCVVLWENVPGVLSDKGNGFGCILGELSGAGCQLQPPGGKWGNAGCVFGPERTVAWRVLDSQFFGVAQRRRRLFVVASAGDGCRPEEVLFEFDGVRRDSPPSREAGEGVTHDLAPCLTSGGRGVQRAGESRWQDPVVACMAHGQANAEICENQSPTLNCNHEVPIAFCASGKVAHSLRGESFNAGEDGTIRGTPHGGVQMAIAFERRFVRTSGGQPSVNLQPCLRVDTNTGDGAPCVAFDTTQITSPGNYSRPKQGDPCHPLASGAHPPCVAIQDVRGLDKKQNGRGYNADGTSYTVDAMATQGVAYGFTTKESGKDAAADIIPPLLAESGDPHMGGRMAVAFGGDIARTLTARHDSSPCADRGVDVVATGMQVRRLTPRECERLQGLPDNWTLIPWRGKPAEQCPDGPRYKGIGNGQTVNVMRWLAERIKKEIAK